MTVVWYKIFNLAEFEALGIPSKEYTFVLEVIGQKTILVTKGVSVSMVYEGELLPIGFSDENPYAHKEGDFSIYKDPSDDVWLGVEVEE